MSAERIAAALVRLESVLRLRPTFGDCEETPAIARWRPGWLMRAGAAAVRLDLQD